LIPTTLQRYVLRETARVALLSAVALTGIIFAGMGVSLVNKGLNIVQLRSIVPFIATFSLPYALPTALLLASVFVFGRLSGANEITAVRGSGINLNHLIVPLLLLAMAVSAGTFWLNHYLLPWSLRRVKGQTERLIVQVLQKMGNVQMVYPIGRYVIYVGGLNEQTRFWQNVAVVEFAANEFPSRIMMARQAHYSVDEEHDIVKLLLFDAVVMQPQLGEELEDQQPSGTFARLSHAIDLNTAARVSSQRPKYAPLPELRRRLVGLRADAAEARARAENPSVLAHPKTARKLAERTANASYRKWQEVGLHMSGHKKTADAAVAAMVETKGLLREAQAEREAALQRRDDVQWKLEDRKPYLDQLQKELKSLISRNADATRIKSRRQEIKRETTAIAELEVRLNEANSAVDLANETLRGVEDRRRAQEDGLGSAEVAVAASQQKVKAARESYEKDNARVDDIKRVEYLLRAQTEMHFRNAGAVTSLIFVLIGIPLGILSRRGSVLMAFVVSFFAVLILYYPLMVVGKMLSLDGYLAPWIAQWMPNVAVGGVGVILLVWGIRR